MFLGEVVSVAFFFKQVNLKLILDLFMFIL